MDDLFVRWWFFRTQFDRRFFEGSVKIEFVEFLTEIRATFILDTRKSFFTTRFCDFFAT